MDDQVWAAGHDGVILHSADGGKTWQAQRRDPYALAAGEQADDHDPRQGAPILDILFTDASNGIAVGALQPDAGHPSTAARPGRRRQAIAASAEPAAEAARRWRATSSAQEDLLLDEESDPHLNAIASTGSGSLVIVGERGTVPAFD